MPGSEQTANKCHFPFTQKGDLARCVGIRALEQDGEQEILTPPLTSCQTSDTSRSVSLSMMRGLRESL